ncbi:MAG TPA: nucleotide exchange factor GrpE [Ktedonobacterales bacterium]|jgi:molecular chaperone GrpE|nr:nucleotide exchange factor GrpE [Ktedonobacterales bacterium]
MADEDVTKDQQADQEQTQGAETERGSAAPGQAGDLAAQLQVARQEAAEYKDKYLRALAEMDNFRKRMERSSAERAERTRREVVTKLLDTVVDNVERALSHEATMDRDALAQTLNMVQSLLNEFLRSEGLSAVPSVGEPFNPQVHEAVEMVSSPEHPEGTVVGEHRKGYTIGGNELLRPARVAVSNGDQS